MFNSAIIDYDCNFSYFNEFLFKLGKLNEKKFCDDIIIENKIIKIIKFPACGNSLLNKNSFSFIADKFIKFLKNKKIEKIIFSDEALKIINIKEKLKYDFQIFDGESIIKIKFKYIINKCIRDNENTEIVLFSNNFEKFYIYFKLIFENYRINHLVTDYKNLFVSFIDEIFNEYGFLINIYNKEEFIKEKNNFIINIDTASDNNFDLDISNIKIIFYKNFIFDKLINYFKNFDNKLLEFIIYNLYGDTKKSNITDFFNKYNIRIVKIYKK